ncbi:DUF2333 family protein [Magnetospira sp. QH-2]|uniref:DUF2333 family protein n=1 Tax=Magnetospira sp. (strain QH-2) TaxID=1288970 RepID=UPI0003E81907|nr:DUF2333 family protein [Magnetospira sp. QH-2]CCQ75694.1 conserved protein of unknown function [Magnetospira sp. QH-2]
MAERLSKFDIPRLEFKGGAKRIGLGIFLALLLYYPLGMLIIHSVDDDLELAVTETVDGGSHAVAIAEVLIARETDENRWTANDPFFLPGAALDNMPHFQRGIIYALSRFAIEMSDHIGRMRGSSQVDADLDKAAGLLKYPGDVWWFDLSTSLAPTAASEAQYRSARRALHAYNGRLARGEAVFERRADNLEATLERIAADLGSASATIDQHLDANSGFLLDFKVDDIFYRNKGRLYAYYMLLRELKKDYAHIIQEKELTGSWGALLDSLSDAAVLQPLVVVNGSPDSQVLPSHLASQGFYLLRARTQLREIANILLK